MTTLGQSAGIAEPPALPSISMEGTLRRPQFTDLERTSVVGVLSRTG
ncbi:hypothetical protein K2O51_12030 [Cupriavidus pinatubonensis]|nr:hypothetical protein [Cupriavidus pinatubonensis]QYY28584.1 hypothetical protein K2O51_12030 [Cupriavidus pinatubonensis]